MITRTLSEEAIKNLLKSAEFEEDAKMVVTRCAIHPEWSFTGTAEDGHFAFILHKEVSHGQNR